MKKILSLSALALFLSVAGASATLFSAEPASACQIYNCPVNGG
jgi:hypothetical protein